MSIIFNIIFWVQNFFFQEVYYEPSLFRKRKQNSLVFVVWLKVSYGLSARNSDASLSEMIWDFKCPIKNRISIPDALFT